ncbi:MAG: DUF1493 family protein [Bacteroidetes bacterium]|nr:DUF1493 family protein [Bacteroidota bacterium]
MEVKEIEFEKLRHAYITVKNFVETEAWGEIKSLKTKTEFDLGIAGDDAYELLEKFVVKFELDPKNFEFLDHFTGEAELAEGCMWTLLALPVFLSLKTIELITHDKVQFSKFNFIHSPNKLDLTFRI